MTAVETPDEGATDNGPQVLMHSLVRVEVTEGPDKLVWLPTEAQPVSMGMHDELAAHYKAAPGFSPRASTLDYVIGAVAACMAGTFRRALAARGVRLAVGDLRSEGIGEIVIEHGVPLIRAIEVRYQLSGTHSDQQDAVQRAHAVHHRACAVSRSVDRAIDITTVLELL